MDGNLDDNRRPVYRATVKAAVSIVFLEPSHGKDQRPSSQEAREALSVVPPDSPQQRPVVQESPGQVHFFGVWADPQSALANYLCVADDLHAGRRPSTSRIAGNAVAVKDVCNHDLTFQPGKLDAGETRASTFADCRRIVKSFARIVGRSRAVADLGPKDFQQFRHKISPRGLTGNGKRLFTVEENGAVAGPWDSSTHRRRPAP
jgi:hypothetical protein